MKARFLCLVLVLAACSAALAKPNVVIFLADDAGWGDYSHSGNTVVRTPHIDSLARGGVSLDRFFVQPVCAPTRAEFLTWRDQPLDGRDLTPLLMRQKVEWPARPIASPSCPMSVS